MAHLQIHNGVFFSCQLWNKFQCNKNWMISSRPLNFGYVMVVFWQHLKAAVSDRQYTVSASHHLFSSASLQGLIGHFNGSINHGWSGLLHFQSVNFIDEYDNIYVSLNDSNLWHISNFKDTNKPIQNTYISFSCRFSKVGSHFIFGSQFIPSLCKINSIGMYISTRCGLKSSTIILSILQFPLIKSNKRVYMGK